MNKHMERTRKIMHKQQERQANLWEKNRKYRSLQYQYDHVEFIFTCNSIILIILLILQARFPHLFLESLLCLDILSLMFYAVIWYRKHATL